MFEYLQIENLLNLDCTIAYDLFGNYTYPWEVLPHIGEFILETGQKLCMDDYTCKDGNIWIHKEVKIASTASITGPAIICRGAEIRHCAFIRGNAIVGEGAVVGNSCELKNCILFDRAQVPHYNYVGDSILGTGAHLGAGAVTSNLKIDKTNVTVKTPDAVFVTGLKKFGAVVGDFSEIGCNSVLNPGTVIGRFTNIYPLSSVRGYVAENSIYKSPEKTVKRRKL